jgi:hypothetical protein
VRDILNPEYFAGEYRRADGTWASAKYRDQLDEALPPNAEVRYAERTPLLVVPVPGEAPWLAAALAEEGVFCFLLGGAVGGGIARYRDGWRGLERWCLKCVCVGGGGLEGDAPM